MLVTPKKKKKRTMEASSHAELSAELERLLHSGAGHVQACNALLRTPRSAQRLFALLEHGLCHSSSAAPLLLAAQLAQRSTRRCPVDEIPDFDLVLAALREASRRGATAIATQSALGCSVLLLRAHAPETLLAELGDKLAAPEDHPCLLAVLTLLAEELHAPASKISAAPQHTAAVKAALRQSAPAVLGTLDTWCSDAAATEPHGLRAVDALRCAHAWCIAGLVSADAAAASPMLTTRAAGYLTVATRDAPTSAADAHNSLATQAAETLCAALGTAEQALAASAASDGGGRAVDARGGTSLSFGNLDPMADALLLPGLACGLRTALATMPLSRHAAAVACEACSVLARHAVRCELAQSQVHLT